MQRQGYLLRHPWRLLIRGRGKRGPRWLGEGHGYLRAAASRLPVVIISPMLAGVGGSFAAITYIGVGVLMKRDE